MNIFSAGFAQAGHFEVRMSAGVELVIGIDLSKLGMTAGIVKGTGSGILDESDWGTEAEAVVEVSAGLSTRAPSTLFATIGPMSAGAGLVLVISGVPMSFDAWVEAVSLEGIEAIEIDLLAARRLEQLRWEKLGRMWVAGSERHLLTLLQSVSHVVKRKGQFTHRDSLTPHYHRMNHHPQPRAP